MQRPLPSASAHRLIVMFSSPISLGRTRVSLTVLPRVRHESTAAVLHVGLVRGHVAMASRRAKARSLAQWIPLHCGLLAQFLDASRMTSFAGTVPFLSCYSPDSRTLTLIIDSDFQALNLNPKNVAIEEPTLPLPRPEGPEPMRSKDFLPPPSTKVINH